VPQLLTKVTDLVSQEVALPGQLLGRGLLERVYRVVVGAHVLGLAGGEV
jgi:hypothetical protein